MRSQWKIVGVKDGIIFVQDLDGATSVTNDAEQVLKKVKGTYGLDARVVYRGTDGEWFEIIPSRTTWMGTGIGFEPWHGLEWDLLKRKQS